MKESRIAMKSKAAIKAAFLNLMQNKHYTKITVREITELADVNRSTFYSHYRDIYDLLDRIENEIISDVSKMVASINRENYVPGQHPQHTGVFRALDKYEHEFQIIMGENGDIKFVNKMIACLRDAFYHCWDNYYDQIPEAADLCTNYVSCAIMGTFLNNISNKKYTIEEMGFFTGEITNWIDNNFMKGNLEYDFPKKDSR